MATKHRFDSDRIENYRATFLEQMKSPFLPDEISRVIREPLRKLTREERLVGPAMLACELGGQYQALAEMIASALTLDNAADAQCRELEALAFRPPQRSCPSAHRRSWPDNVPRVGRPRRFSTRDF